MVRKFAYNVGYLDVFLQFLELDGTITNAQQLFEEQIFLSVAGARKLRGIWLRHLGFFPKKAVEVASEAEWYLVQLILGVSVILTVLVCHKLKQNCIH